MTYFDWNNDKNEELKKKRNISFERITTQIENGKFFEIIDHPNKKKYPTQKIYIVEYENYIYLVPFVKDGNKIFLKTIIPNSKATKKYLRKNYEL